MLPPVIHLVVLSSNPQCAHHYHTAADLLMLQIAVSIATHAQDLPELTHSATYEETPGANKEAMISKWQEWLQAAGT